MRTTIDLPDATFRRLKALCAERGTSLKQVFRAAVERELAAAGKPRRRRVRLPILDSKEPASLRLTNAGIEDLLA